MTFTALVEVFYLLFMPYKGVKEDKIYEKEDR